MPALAVSRSARPSTIPGVAGRFTSHLPERLVGSGRSQPLPKSAGPTGYGRDGYCAPETTGGELTIFTWPGRWHTVELAVAVHWLIGPVGAAAAIGAKPIAAAAAAMASGTT